MCGCGGYVIPDQHTRTILKWVATVPAFLLGHYFGKLVIGLTVKLYPFEKGYIEALFETFFPWIASGFLAAWFAMSIAPNSRLRAFVVSALGILGSGLLGFGAWATYAGAELSARNVVIILVCFGLYLLSVFGAILAYQQHTSNVS